jgi:hypothetical protein
VAELYGDSKPAQRQLSGLFAYAWKLKLMRIALVAAGLMNLHGCATLPNAVREMAIPQRRYAKTACIDGVWSTIGSTNLDWRSFLHNDEINAMILGRGFAVQMEAMFAEDLQESEAIALDQWQHRS